MKDIFQFILWQWRRFELWQKWFIIASVFAGAGMTADEPYKYYILMVPVFIIFGSMIKWVIWDQTIESWKTYKKEKTQLFEIIKTSDQK